MMRVEGGTVGADPAAPAVLEAAHAPSAALAATRKGRLPDQRGGGGARLLERPLAAAAAAAAAAARHAVGLAAAAARCRSRSR